MSFVEREDVLAVNERMLAHVLGAVGIAIELPLPRLSYDEALARYGTDKPDLRYGLEIAELTDAFRGTEFNAFGGVIEDGGVVRGINAGGGERSRSELDGLVGEAQELGAKGLVWAVREADGWRSPVAKFISADEVDASSAALGAGEGDLLVIVADRAPIAAAVLGQLRTRLAERQGLVPAGENRLCWILDWPLVEWNEAEGRWDALHHPFTSPAGELDPANPAAARALIYDVAWNGQEIGGGSIRISDPDVQRRVFEVIGIAPEEAEERFGFLLEALRYGAPPHGGIAYGIDRIVALAHGVESIRDVIAFPKAASGSDPLTGAPAQVSDEQLRELGIALRTPPPAR
jgi:aspartyl-tRNA synthetase